MAVFSLAREARNAGQANDTDDNEIIGSDDKNSDSDNEIGDNTAFTKTVHRKRI